MSNELATGYVSIVATSNDLGADITKSLRGVQKSASGYGRGIGDAVGKGFKAANPVDLKDLEQRFETSEKSRAATIRKSTTEIEGLRRKESIAQAQLTEAEKKYEANSVQVLRAKDRHITASQKVALAEAKQSVEISKADKAVQDAKGALDEYARGAESSAKGISGSFERVGPAISGAFGKVRGLFSRTAKDGAAGGVETGKEFSKGLDKEFATGARTAGETFKGVLGGILASKAITGVVSGIRKVLAGAFGGGFARVMNIEAAEIKLDTIYKGDASKVAAAMASVSDSVDGTKFALSDAADMASQLAAAGYEAGEDMTRWLALTGDAAQFNNKEFSEMQGIIGKVAATGKVTGETFDSLPIAASALAEMLGVSQEEVRKLAADGKISADQFATAMENVIGGAAKNAGDSFTSLRDNMKSAMNATMANIIGPVTDGLKPIMSAGLGLLKGFRDNVSKPLGESLSEWIQPRAESIAETLTALPETIGNIRGQIESTLGGIKALIFEGDFTSGLFGLEEDSPVIGVILGIRDTVISVFDAAKEAVTGFIDGFGGMDAIGDAVGPLVSMLAGPLGLVKDVLLDLFKDIDFTATGKLMGESFRPIVDAAVDLYEVLSGTVLDVVRELLPVVGEIAKTVLPLLGEALTTVAPLFGQLASAVVPLVGQLVSDLAPVLTDLVKQLLPPVLNLIKQLAPVIMAVVKAVVPLVAKLAGALVPVIGMVVSALVPVITTLVDQLAPIILDIVKTVLPPLMTAFDAVADLLETVVVPVLGMLVGFISGVLVSTLNALMPIVKTVFGFISRTIQNAMNLVSGIIKTVTSIIKGDWSGAWDGIKQIGAAYWDQIKNVISTAITIVKDTISGVVQTISDIWGGTWDKIKGAGQAAWDWIKDTALSVFDSMRGGVENTFGKLAAAIGWIWDGIKATIGKPINIAIGFINDGIIGAYNWVASKLGLPEMGKIPTLNLSTASTANRGLGTGGGGRAIAAFQDGGYVDLPWSSTNRDPYLGVSPKGMLRFEGEEFIVNRRRTKQYLPLLEMINAGTLDTHGIPGLKGGGLVSFKGHTFSALFAGLLREAERIAGSSMRISQGGYRPRTSYSGTSHQKDAVDITGSYRPFIAPLRSLGIPTWDRAGKGNWVDHAHGVPLPGSGTAGGSAIWQAQDYLRGGDGLGGRDNGPRGGAISGIINGIAGAISSGFDSVAGWFGGIVDKITGSLQGLTSAGGGVFGDLVGAVGKTLQTGVLDWVEGKLGLGERTGELDTDRGGRRKVPGYATGTTSALPGLAWVGERGPELVDFRGGERVWSAGASSEMTRAITVGQVSVSLPNVTTWQQIEEFLQSLEDSRRHGHMMGV